MKDMKNMKKDGENLIFSDSDTSVPGNTIKMSVVDNTLKVEYEAKKIS